MCRRGLEFDAGVGRNVIYLTAFPCFLLKSEYALENYIYRLQGLDRIT